MPVIPPTAQTIIERFGLEPHPEGGYYRETYRAELRVRHPGIPEGRHAERSASTAIVWLLTSGDFSAFHRVTWTDEVYHLYTGDPIELHLIDEGGRHERRVLSSDPAAGDPTTVVPAGCWQAFRLVPGGSWAFGGCTVAPGFDFADFEMPGREELTAVFPTHAEIIRELTRGA